jgi:hypothetical protein
LELPTLWRANFIEDRMTAQSLRAKVFAELDALGFEPANSLPLPDMDLPIREPSEVAARLVALAALFTWVAAPEEKTPSDRVNAHIARNGVRDWLTEEETAILDLPRDEAHETYVDMIGWKLENMWALAWVLGFEPAPNLQASQIEEDVIGSLFPQFLPRLDQTVADLLARATPRTADEVIEIEYRFYCAHNAVRSAQLGGRTVPEGFHPIIHGGAIHERRHALSWCIAPEGAWEDTNLDT